MRPGQWWAALGYTCLRTFGVGLAIGTVLVWWVAP